MNDMKELSDMQKAIEEQHNYAMEISLTAVFLELAAKKAKLSEEKFHKDVETFFEEKGGCIVVSRNEKTNCEMLDKVLAILFDKNNKLKQLKLLW